MVSTSNGTIASAVIASWFASMNSETLSIIATTKLGLLFGLAETISLTICANAQTFSSKKHITPINTNSDMETKTAKAIALFNARKFREAFRIFKTFRGKFSPEQKRSIEIAYECMTGKSAFYSILGINTEDMIKEAVATIKSLYAI